MAPKRAKKDKTQGQAKSVKRGQVRHQASKSRGRSDQGQSADINKAIDALSKAAQAMAETMNRSLDVQLVLMGRLGMPGHIPAEQKLDSRDHAGPRPAAIDLNVPGSAFAMPERNLEQKED